MRLLRPVLTSVRPAQEYRGYLHPKAGPKASPEDRVISVHFGWWGQAKAVSSILMGSTPEFELALYTMCFLGGAEQNVVWLDDFQVLIKAYRIRSNKGGGHSAVSIAGSVHSGKCMVRLTRPSCLAALV